MASGKPQAPRGTFDVLPDAGARRETLRDIAEATLDAAGYGAFASPIFEDTELFARGVGESTDIVQKEMFTFTDKSDRSLTLRPEGTAGTCRAYIEHGMHKLPQPVKLRYFGPFFRHERAQAGRFRQFTQFGAEALGSDDPSLDAEIIVLLASICEEAGVEYRVRLSSLGDAPTRAAYGDQLRTYLHAHEDQLSTEVRERIDLNPLRAFDADHEGTRAVMAGAPLLTDLLTPEDAAHFADVRALLDEVGQPYELDPTLVRGLDYYTRTVFEFDSPALGAQSAIGGGGRYDGLVEQLGGPSTPAVGFAAGVERIVLADTDDELEPVDAPPVYVAVTDPAARALAFRLATELRRRGQYVLLEQAGRSIKGQLKQADRAGAAHTVIVGEAIELRDMGTGDQRPLSDIEELLAELAGTAGQEDELDELDLEGTP